MYLYYQDVITFDVDLCYSGTYMYVELITYGLNHSDGNSFAFPQSNSFTTVSSLLNADDKISTSSIGQSHQHLCQHILVR